MEASKIAELRAMKEAAEAPWDLAVQSSVRRHVYALSKYEQAKSRHFDGLLDEIENLRKERERADTAFILAEGAKEQIQQLSEWCAQERTRAEAAEARAAALEKQVNDLLGNEVRTAEAEIRAAALEAALREACPEDNDLYDGGHCAWCGGHNGRSESVHDGNCQWAHARRTLREHGGER
jgi:hypothetical protein